MRALLKLSAGIDAAIDFIGRSASWLVLIIIVVGVYNVAARYVGSAIGITLASNTWIDVQWQFFTVIFFLAASYVLRHNEHVRVDFLYGNWPPKRKALVNVVGTILFLLPFCVVALWVSFRPVLISWGYNPLTGAWRTWELSANPGGLPLAPVKSMIIVGFVLLFIQGISELIKNIAVLTGARESEERTLEDTFKPAHESAAPAGSGE